MTIHLVVNLLEQRLQDIYQVPGTVLGTYISDSNKHGPYPCGVPEQCCPIELFVIMCCSKLQSLTTCGFWRFEAFMTEEL